MTTAIRRSASLVLAVATVAACHKKQVASAPAPAPVASSPSTDNTDRDRLERERLERERLERERAERARALAAMQQTMAAPIYFGFDRSDLTPEARETLEAKRRILSENPSMRIRLEGNADDLGSDEYNLALGQRRAAEAKRYLTDREIDAARIEITSFGEERPACQQPTDDCRAKNRRDEVRITSGGPVVSGR